MLWICLCSRNIRDMRGILEAMHDYPDEALGLCFFLIVIVWLLSGIFEKKNE